MDNVKNIIRETVDKFFNQQINKELVPIKPNKFVYHKSNPIFRENILKIGLIPKGKSEAWLSDTKIEGKVIFATNSENIEDWFDSIYDDDIYQINTIKLNNKWFVDPNFLRQNITKYIITFDKIPLNAIKLIYKGSGKSFQ